MRKSVILLGIILVFMLTGCTERNKDESQVEAREAEKLYEQDFIDAVEDAYGDVNLRDIECPVSSSVDDAFQRIYHASDYLAGKMTYNGKTYEVKYLFEKGTVISSVSAPEVLDSWLDSLPIDKSQIIQAEMFGSGFGDVAEFSAGVITIQEAAADIKAGHNPYGNVDLKILTSEDISGLTGADFDSYVMSFRDCGALPFQVSIFSSDDFTELDYLKVHLSKVEACRSWSEHPKIEWENKLRDIYDVFNFNNTLSLDSSSYEKGGYDIRIFLTQKDTSLTQTFWTRYDEDDNALCYFDTDAYTWIDIDGAGSVSGNITMSDDELLNDMPVVNDILQQLTDSDEFQNADDDGRYKLLFDTLSWLEDEGRILNLAYDEDEKMFFYQYAYGALGGWSLHPNEFDPMFN